MEFSSPLGNQQGISMHAAYGRHRPSPVRNLWGDCHPYLIVPIFWQHTGVSPSGYNHQQQGSGQLPHFVFSVFTHPFLS